MQLSVDQKIQAAVTPLLERIAALEAQNKLFKEEIISIQNQAPSKNIHKPINKAVSEHMDRPQMGKVSKKEIEHLEPKHEAKVIHKSGQKKEQHKVQNDEGKVQGSKVGAKTPIPSSKALTSPTTHKDSNDPKSVKTKPIVQPVSKPTNVDILIKGATNDKKQLQHKNKNNQGQPQKKETEQEKKHASKQKQHKASSFHGVKGPAVNKSKLTQPQPTNKKPLPQTKPQPKPVKGAKPKPATETKLEKAQKEQLAPHETKAEEAQLYAHQDEALGVAKQQGPVSEHAFLQLQHLQKPEQKKQELEQNLKASEHKEEKTSKPELKPQEIVGTQQQTS